MKYLALTFLLCLLADAEAQGPATERTPDVSNKALITKATPQPKSVRSVFMNCSIVYCLLV
ncbi:MAG TPA: hypothetical protein VG095_03825, partial [Chthoniobacterales bacterium]|nr:hypothetical protein [Chthoniobacterales bacterium]